MRFTFLLSIICIIGATSLSAQINDYIIEEETFGLPDNKFNIVSDTINGNFYILDSLDLWVHNIETATTTNLIKSENTLFAHNFIYYKGFTFFTLACSAGTLVVKTQNTKASTQVIFKIADNYGDFIGAEYSIFKDQLIISKYNSTEIYLLSNPHTKPQLFIDLKDLGDTIHRRRRLRKFFTVDSTLFFKSFRGDTTLLRSTNGIASTVKIVEKFNGEPLYNPKWILKYNNTFYFSIDDNKRRTLVYDTILNKVKIFNNFELSEVGPAYKNGLIFGWRNPKEQLRNELWLFDGTKSGTHFIKDINRIMRSSPSKFQLFKDKFVFHAGINERWESDGTTNGTKKVGILDFETNVYQLRDRRFELSKIDDDKIVLSEYLGDGVLNEIKTIEGSLGYQTYSANINDEFFLFYVRNKDGSEDNWYSDGTATNTNRLVDSLNYGKISKILKLKDRAIMTIRHSKTYKNYNYRVRKSDAIIKEVTLIDDALETNSIPCSK